MSITFAPATIRTRDNVIEHHDGAEWEHITVNANDTNAVRVLELLGLLNRELLAVGEIYGDRPAEQFLGAVLLAEALTPIDEGVPAYQSRPNFYECGRAAGYLQFRLDELRTLAEYCLANGYVVAWA